MHPKLNISILNDSYSSVCIYKYTSGGLYANAG